MENTEQKLTEYIRTKYDPVAIVLHGSRANGMAREHSDWDIVIFTDTDKKPLTREIIFRANMELKQYVLQNVPPSPDQIPNPIADQAFLGFFFRSENTKVLYDPQVIIPAILHAHDAKVAEGNGFMPEDIGKRKAFLQSALDGIEDYANDPLILFDKKIDFYSRIVRTWFQFVKNEYEPSHYYAFPKIKESDPELYDLIHDFIKETGADQLLRIGAKIMTRIFPLSSLV